MRSDTVIWSNPTLSLIIPPILHSLLWIVATGHLPVETYVGKVRYPRDLSFLGNSCSVCGTSRKEKVTRSSSLHKIQHFYW